jgi:hypothetical protein
MASCKYDGILRLPGVFHVPADQVELTLTTFVQQCLRAAPTKGQLPDITPKRELGTKRAPN